MYVTGVNVVFDLVQDFDSQQLAEGLWKTVSQQQNADALTIADSNALLVYVGNKVSLQGLSCLFITLCRHRSYQGLHLPLCACCAAAVGRLVCKPSRFCSAAAAGQYQVSQLLGVHSKLVAPGADALLCLLQTVTLFATLLHSKFLVHSFPPSAHMQKICILSCREVKGLACR